MICIVSQIMFDKVCWSDDYPTESVRLSAPIKKGILHLFWIWFPNYKEEDQKFMNKKKRFWTQSDQMIVGQKALGPTLLPRCT